MAAVTPSPVWVGLRTPQPINPERNHSGRREIVNITIEPHDENGAWWCVFYVGGETEGRAATILQALLAVAECVRDIAAQHGRPSP